MASHVPAQPVVAAGSATKGFITTLQIADRSFTNELIQRYGNERYMDVVDLLGRKYKVDNGLFYHREKRKRMPSVQVASFTGGAAPNADCIATITAGSHFDSGTKSPGRVGEVVMIASNGILGKISAVGGSASAHEYTIKPLRATDTFAPAANDHLLFQGAQHVGEGSGRIVSMQPIVDKIENTTTEIREDYDIKDRAAQEKIEFADPKTGKYSYRYYGTSEAEARFLNNRELLTVFSHEVTNTGITSNGTAGTKGMITQATAGGSSLGYTPNMLSLDNFQAVDREMTFNGVGTEVHVLQDVFQNQEAQRFLFNLYGNGAILWGSVGGNKEVAAKFGFSSFSLGSRTYHLKTYAPFSPEWMYGVNPAVTPKYRHYGLFLPQGFGEDGHGKRIPTVSLMYQEATPGQELNAFESGGLAQENKTTTMELINTIIGYYGVRLAAANQCVILEG